MSQFILGTTTENDILLTLGSPSIKIKDINKKGKIAIVVGGTGLYFKSLTDGLSEIPFVPKLNMNSLYCIFLLIHDEHNRMP